MEISEERQAQIKELRERLRAKREEQSGTDNGRAEQSSSKSVSGASTNPERHSTNKSATAGHSVQSVSGSGNRVSSVGGTIDKSKRTIADVVRGATQVDHGVRLTDRRSSEDNRQGWADGTDLPASVSTGEPVNYRQEGNLFTDEVIPPRNFDTETKGTVAKPEDKRATSKSKGSRQDKPGVTRDVQSKPLPEPGQKDSERKEEAERKQSWLNKGVLTKAEAEELEEPFIQAIKDELGGIDKAIWAYTHDELEQPVWSDISDKEAKQLAHAVLRLGTKSPTMATVARTSVDGNDYVAAAQVVGPRFIKTAGIIRAERKRRSAYAAERKRNRA